MKEFFGFGGYKRPVEGFLSWQHLTFVSVLMVIMIACAVFLGLKTRNKDMKTKNKVLIWTAILIDGVELFKIVLFCIRGKDPWGWFDLLPLYFCSMQLIAIPLCAFSKGKVKEASLDFVFIFGLVAGIIGTYGAGNNYSTYPVLCIDNVVSGITHTISGFASLYVAIAKMMTMRKENAYITGVILLVFCVLAFIANAMFDCNYMFLRRGDGTPYDLVYNWVNGNKYLYPTLVILLFLVYIAVFYLVYHLIMSMARKKKVKKAKIIILAGQSNAVGVGHIQYLPKYYDQKTLEEFENGYEKILINYYSHGNWSNGFVKTDYSATDNVNTFGPEIGLAKKLKETNPDEEYFIVKCAVGGVNLYRDFLSPSSGAPAYCEEHKKATKCWREMNPLIEGWCYYELVRILRESISLLKEKGYEPKISALCWMQGESDAVDTFKEDAVREYVLRFNNMVADLRTELDGYFEDFTVVDAGIAEEWVRHNELNACKKANAQEQGWVYLDTVGAGLTTRLEPTENPDIAHYDSQSLVRLGEMFAEGVLRK